jgi:hypothetical protein
MKSNVRFFKLAALLLLPLLGGWAFTRSSLFRISRIEVVTEDEALAKAVRERFVGLFGRGIFSVSLSSLDRGVRAFPRIRKVSLRRRWPSTLLVRLDLRPVAALEFHQGKLWTVDDEGARIEPLSSPVSAPLMKGFGDDIEARRMACRWLSSLSSFEGSHLEASSVDEIEWKKDRGLVAHVSELDLEVELGFEDFANAFSRADLAFGVLKSKSFRANFLDASSVRRVVARGAPSLQNPDSGLTFKEKTRRSGSPPAAAR